MQILKAAVSRAGGDGKSLLVGDLNTKDDEICDVRKELGLQEARYSGFSFGAQGNRFDHSLQRLGSEARYDRVLFGQNVWGESHLVGNGSVYFEGSEFWLSDHCGLLAYVDLCDAYGSKAKQDVPVARARRGQLVSLRDVNQQKELVEVKARRQQGREEQALARRRAAERDRASFLQGQRRGAQQRRKRRDDLQRKAFGADGFFGDAALDAVASSNVCHACAPSDISFAGLDDVPQGSWRTVKDVPLLSLIHI